MSGRTSASPLASDQPAGTYDASVLELDGEVAVTTGDVGDPPGPDVPAVGPDLAPADLDQLVGRGSLTPQVSVHVPGPCVARVAGVDDQHGAPRPGQHRWRH